MTVSGCLTVGHTLLCHSVLLFSCCCCYCILWQSPPVSNGQRLGTRNRLASCVRSNV